MGGRRISLAIVLICGSALATQSPAYGVWNRPGNLAHYIGYGTGAGLHAPMGCKGGCNRGTRRQPMAIPNWPTYALHAMPSAQQFYSTPSPTIHYRYNNHQHGNYGHGPAIQNYSPQPAPVITVPQDRFIRPAQPLPKTNKPTPAAKSEGLPVPTMPTPEPTLLPTPVPTS